MKITNGKRKVKIEFEYSKASDLLGFDTITEDDLKQLVVNVFLKNGRRIYHDELEKITLKIIPDNKKINKGV